MAPVLPFRSVALTLLVLALGHGSASAQWRKLSGPLQGTFLSDVASFTVTSSGQAVYHVTEYGSFDALLAAPIDAGPSVVLHAFAFEYASLGRMETTSDGEWLVYTADQDVENRFELFSVPVLGTGPSRKLSVHDVSRFLSSFQVAPDGSWAVYQTDGFGTAPARLHGVPIDGGAPPVLLSGALDAGADYWITADSSRLIFKEGNLGGVLYGVPLRGGTLPLRLSAPGQVAFGLRPTPDGERAIYTAADSTAGTKLFSVPIDGSLPPIRLDAPLGTGRSVLSSFEISPDSTRVVYIELGGAGTERELFSVPTTGGKPVRLSEPADGIVRLHRISPDSTLVVYTVSSSGSNATGSLHLAPIDGRVPSVLLSGRSRVRLETSDFAIDSSSQHVVYRAHARVVTILELHSVPLRGALGPLQARPQRVLGRDVVDFQLAPGTDQVVFRAHPGTTVISDLYRVPADGSTEAVQINPDLPAGASIEEYAAAHAGGRVLYVSDHDTLELFELFSAPLDGSAAPTTRSDIRHYLDAIGGVFDMTLSPDGRTAVYHARELAGTDLYAVDLETGERTALEARSFPPAGPWQYVVAPDGQRVVFSDPDDNPFDENTSHVFSVPLDGSALPVPLTHYPSDGEILEGEVEVTADSRRVVYVRHEDDVWRIYSAPTDGSAPPVVLHESSTFFTLSPDGSRVLLPFDDRTGGVDLGSVPAAGGSFVPLFDAAPGQTWSSAVFSPDSRQVVFRANPGGFDALLRAPIDGSVPPVELSGPGGVVHPVIVISPDGKHVLYYGRETGDSQLYTVPLAGGPTTELTAFPTGRGAILFAVSPDSTRVVYLADQDEDDLYEIYMVPIDGGALPIKLSEGDCAPRRALFPLRLTCDPTSTYVVYLADRDRNEVYEVFSARLDGSAPPVGLNPALVPGGDVHDYQIAPTGNRVLLEASAFRPNVHELFVAPLDGAEAAVQVSGSSFSTETVEVSGLFTPDGDRVVYQADDDSPGTSELYLYEGPLPRSGDAPLPRAIPRLPRRGAR